MSKMKHTPGPWKLFIDDTGGQWSGWPLCIDAENDDDKNVVRTGGQWPYEWDAAMSQREAVANARLIAAAPELLDAAVEFCRRVEAGDIRSKKTYATFKALIAKATGAPQ